MADSTNPVAPNAPAHKMSRAATILTGLGLVIGVLFAAAGLAAGLGARLGLWHFRVGFQILQWATYAALAVIVVSLVGAVLAQLRDLRRARTMGLLGLALGLATAAPPLYQYYIAMHVPSIHDISTDTVNPPTYVAVVARRANSDNSLEPDADTARKQAEAYPDIKPVVVQIAPAQALARAESAARGMGWEIVAVDPQAMRIEATATTTMFGFKDDVVIRVAAEGSGSRVDVRSASRVGKSDVGANARRIRAYLKEFGSTS
jgi:uncharacterized protein (DUF1499 family)